MIKYNHKREPQHRIVRLVLPSASPSAPPTPQASATAASGNTPRKPLPHLTTDPLQGMQRLFAAYLHALC
jgi:hypothetical protein